MTRVEPVKRESLSEFEPMFKMVEATMGFVPTSMFTMGHDPGLLRSFLGLAAHVLQGGKIEPQLKHLVSYVASNAAQCRYCQAHTGHTAHQTGVSAEKIAAAFDFDSSPLFTDRERAALDLAYHAALVPNAATDAHFAELHKHFNDAEIVEIVSIVALFGYLNRWNDTMATTLEEGALAFAQQNLAAQGWEVAKHG